MEKPKGDKKLKKQKLIGIIKKFCILGAAVAFLSFVGPPTYEFGVNYYTKVLPHIDRNPAGTTEKVQTISKKIVKGREAKGKSEKYAILLNSGAEPVHPAFYTNMTIAFDALKSKGFSEKNIIVLNANGSILNYRRFRHLYTSNAQIIDYAATYKNLQKVTHEIAQKIDGNDVFFMYVTNHGMRDFFGNFLRGESNIPLRYGKKARVTERELKKMLSGITKNAQYSVMLFNHCFSGGFAEKLGKGNVIAISVCRKDKYGHSHTFYSPFSESFFSAIKHPADLESRLEADYNKDGKVSIEEAFDYAAKNDDATKRGPQGPLGRQTPQLRYGNIDPTKTYFPDDSGHGTDNDG